MDSNRQLSSEQQDRERRLKWFRDARFGMFIHWGLYAQIGRHEWAMNRERIPLAEYEPLADTWMPKRGFAKAWVKLARDTGMRYMVLTTKHHEGFCLWDTKLTDYNAVKRGPGRDLIAEYVEAAREGGMRVGLYYSLNDWHHPDGARCYVDEAARRRFIDYTHGLVRELMTNYGVIDILWYDCPYPLEDAAAWESTKMNAMVRSLQPDILINNRSRLDEDFGTPEQHITPETGGRMWESCMTLNDSWGYTPIDSNYKSAWHIILMLRQVAANQGNLLLNIGPAPDGSIPPVYRRTFGRVGEWLRRNGEAIYDAADPMEQDWALCTGAFTRKGSTAYYTCYRWPGEQLTIGGLKNRVLSVRYLNGSKAKFEQGEDRLIIKGLPAKAPDPLATVFAIEVEGVPRHKLGLQMVTLDSLSAENAG